MNEEPFSDRHVLRNITDQCLMEINGRFCFIL